MAPLNKLVMHFLFMLFSHQFHTPSQIVPILSQSTPAADLPIVSLLIDPCDDTDQHRRRCLLDGCILFITIVLVLL